MIVDVSRKTIDEAAFDTIRELDKIVHEAQISIVMENYNMLLEQVGKENA